jgi:hypothetical protein
MFSLLDQPIDLETLCLTKDPEYFIKLAIIMPRCGINKNCSYRGNLGQITQ